MKALLKNISILILLLLCISCAKEEALPVNVDFEFEVFNNDFTVPVEVILFNATKGADDYLWTFEGAEPQISTQRNPGVVTYSTKGTYTITLKATNEDGSEDTKSETLVIDDPIEIDFSVTPKTDFFSPSSIDITNNTKGAENYKWTFDEGTPSTSTQRNPTGIVFTTPGIHTITLEASNPFTETMLTKEIEVLPLLTTDFDFEVSFEDDDLQIPVKVTTTNKSTSATAYTWNFTGATTTSSTEENPDIIFNTAGLQNISLTATNGKETKTVTKQLELFANTNLRVLENIKLGINTAHNNNAIGAAVNLKDREVFTSRDITEDNGEDIDLVFFGLNNRFTRNLFVSPDNLSQTTFSEITNAKTTRIINNLENCSCVRITNTQFDNMTNDSLLRAFTVTETPAGSLPFDNTVTPRIIIFQTADGRKGAVKIKRFVEDSTNSFIEIDIKVQKEGD